MFNMALVLVEEAVARLRCNDGRSALLQILSWAEGKVCKWLRDEGTICAVTDIELGRMQSL